MDHDRAALNRHRPGIPTLNRLPAWFVVCLAAAPVVFIVGFYAWPVVTLLWSTAQDTTGGGSPYGHILEVIWFTFWQAAVSTVLTLVVIPAVYALVKGYALGARREAVGGEEPQGAEVLR